MDGKRPTVASRHGVVAAAHPLAAAAGARILGRGGNAFDAAVATAAALGRGGAVHVGAGRARHGDLLGGGRPAHPHAGFPHRSAAALPGRPVQPAPEDLHRGAMAVAPPGNLAGWYGLVSAHGTKTLAEVLAPAIELARDGFPLTGFNTAAINAAAVRCATSRSSPPGTPPTQTARARCGRARCCASPTLPPRWRRSPPRGSSCCMAGGSARSWWRICSRSAAAWRMADLDAVSPDWDQAGLGRLSRPDRARAAVRPARRSSMLLTLRILDGFEPRQAGARRVRAPGHCLAGDAAGGDGTARA